MRFHFWHDWTSWIDVPALGQDKIKRDIESGVIRDYKVMMTQYKVCNICNMIIYRKHQDS